MEDAELNALESYFTIENDHVCLNKGVITDLDDEGGSASSGCAITSTPGIGKTFFGLYLLFYIRYNYPDAIIVWQFAEKICYQFSPDGNVQKGDISLFDKTLDNPNNFLLVDAQALTFQCDAYMILFTSPKLERFNEAVKWQGFTQYYMPVWDREEIITLWSLQYKNKKNSKGEEFTLELVGELLGKWGPIPRSVLLKWDDVAYQRKYQQLIDEVNLEDCINSIDKSGMSAGAISAHKEYYNRPKSKTFASIDSFSLNNKTLDLYQITVSTNHSMKDVKDFNLYFVVPPDIFETFHPQRYKTAKGEDCQKIPGWINNITQYVLEINLGISNKGAKKRTSDTSGDDDNEKASEKEMDNKDIKKRKTEKIDAISEDDSDAMFVEDESGETSKKGKNKKDQSTESKTHENLTSEYLEWQTKIIVLPGISIDEIRPKLYKKYKKETGLDPWKNDNMDKALTPEYLEWHAKLTDLPSILSDKLHEITELKKENIKIKTENTELRQDLDEFKKELESKKNCKFQEKCILIAQVLLGEKPIIEYRPPFLNGLELDAFFQKYQIALEVQGAQHRFHNTSWYKDIKKLEDIVNRDRLKRCMCQDNGIFLLEVWYDENPEKVIPERIQKIKNFVNQAFK
ncbi:5202_t:CDS:2, partial [Racocetra fulgida]